MPPTREPAAVGDSGVRRTPCWARRWGKIVQWSMKAWSRKPRRGDLPMGSNYSRPILEFRHYQGSHRVWKTWKNKIFWKSHGKSWNFEKSSKVMELRKSYTDKSSPSNRNLALISFASHLVSCIHSNTSDYELLGEFEANPLVYCYWLLI